MAGTRAGEDLAIRPPQRQEERSLMRTHNTAGWLAGSLAGWLTGWLTGWLAAKEPHLGAKSPDYKHN